MKFLSESVDFLSWISFPMQYNPYTPAASKKYEVEKKIKKYKNIYDELCQNTQKYEKLGCLNSFDFLPALAGLYLPDRPAGDLPRT